VDKFILYCHLVPRDDTLLRDCFWSGLDLDISFNLPDEYPGWSLVQYIDFVLLFCGSEFTVGEVEEKVSSKKNVQGGSMPWAPVAMESGRPGLPPYHTLMIASPVFITTPMPESIPKMAAMLQTESALKMATMSQPESTFKMAAISRSASKMAAMSQPESAPKIAARPQPEPPPARSASPPATSLARVATSPVWFVTTQPPAIMKATPRTSATMDDTPEFPVVMDVKPEFPVVSSVVFGDNKAFSGRLRLASSLADPPFRSVRTAGIPRPSAVEVLEVVPLSAVPPVMAVAMLCVSLRIQVQFKSLVQSQVQFKNPFRNQVQFKFLFLRQVQSKNVFCSQVQFMSLVLSQVQSKNPFRSQVQFKFLFLS